MPRTQPRHPATLTGTTTSSARADTVPQPMSVTHQEFVNRVDALSFIEDRLATLVKGSTPSERAALLAVVLFAQDGKRAAALALKMRQYDVAIDRLDEVIARLGEVVAGDNLN